MLPGIEPITEFDDRLMIDTENGTPLLGTKTRCPSGDTATLMGFTADADRTEVGARCGVDHRDNPGAHARARVDPMFVPYSVAPSGVSASAPGKDGIGIEATTAPATVSITLTVLPEHMPVQPVA